MFSSTIRSNRPRRQVILGVLLALAASPSLALASGMTVSPGYYTNMQRPPQVTFRDGRYVGRTAAGPVYEVPKGTFGCVKCVLHNTSGRWETYTVRLSMMPWKAYITSRKAYLGPGQRRTVYMPVKFALSARGKVFQVELSSGSTSAVTSSFVLRTGR